MGYQIIETGMNILGIMYGHNASICLMQNGKITFSQSEERLNRIKNSFGFPELTLEHIYNNICPPEKIHCAVLFQKSVNGYIALKNANFESTPSGYLSIPERDYPALRRIVVSTKWGHYLREKYRSIRYHNNPRLIKEARNYFSRALKLPPDKVRYIDHHLAHAYSAVPFIRTDKPTVIFTLDGEGDEKCATVNLYSGAQVKVLSTTPVRNSLGYYYAITTGLLGLKVGEHEFKVMGLAPYTNIEHFQPILDDLQKLLRITDDGQWESSVTIESLPSVLEKIYRRRRFDNISGAIQKLSEDLIEKWVLYWARKINCRSVALAGGVFMNVKVCQRLAALPDIEQLTVVPSASDESCAIGCATAEAFREKTPVTPAMDLYLGIEYTDSEIRECLDRNNAYERYEISEPEDINHEVGRLLADGKIVARFAGRMEFGARALGNRSILANPSDLKTVHRINMAIKSRDFWMPFTPSILEEDMSRYLVNHDRIFAPYMSITFDSTEEARQQIIAALHPFDFTCRPQCVIKNWNPDYYRIISSFKSFSGIGAVLNTSFNLHGQPNVCSPNDALFTIDNSSLEYLAMGSFLLKKRDLNIRNHGLTRF